MITQVAPNILVGTLAERPDPAEMPANYLFRASDTGGCYLLQLNQSTNAKSWVSIIGGSASSWPNYVVSNNPDIPAPYSTIGAANAAAKANGHGPDNPCVILVHPGTFQEDVVLTPGISVEGFVPKEAESIGFTSSNSTVEIVGQVTMDPTVFSGLVDAFLANVVVSAPHNQQAIGLGGSNSIILTLVKVFATNQGGNNVINLTNANNPLLVIDDSTFVQNDSLSSVIGVLQGTSPLVILQRCTITGSRSGTACGVRGSWILRGTRVTGNFILTDGASLSLSESSSVTTNGVELFTITDAASGVDFHDSDYSIGPNDSLAKGAGRFHFNNVLCLSSTPTLLIENTILQTDPQYEPTGYVSRFVEGQGDLAVPVADLVFFTLTGAGTADLPDTRTFGHGRRITLKTNGAFDLLVQAAAGDGVDNSGTTSFTIAAAVTPPFHAATLQCDSNNRTWFVVGVV